MRQRSLPVDVRREEPAPVHAAPLQLPLPGWLQDMLDQLLDPLL